MLVILNFTPVLIVYPGNFALAPVLNVCFGHIVTYVYWVWVPPLILEATLFALTVLKAIRQSRESVRIMPVAQVLYRDGFIYFVVISRKLFIRQWITEDTN